MKIEEKVIEVIRKNSEEEVEEISGDSRLEDDLGLDSFARLMIINGIEEEFNVELKEEDVKSVTTVRDIVEKLRGEYAIGE